MAILATFSVKDLEGALSKQEVSSIEDGALDGDDVWFEFLTQNDERVRPSHQALNGTLWKVDDPDAPCCPLDYGCRCFIRYCSNPNSKIASEILPEAEGELSNRVDAYKTYLSDNVDGWQNVAKEARTVGKGDRLQFIIDALVDADLAASSVARDIAFMILSVL